MRYTKPLLELQMFDVEDIITESSAQENPPVMDEFIVQVPTGGTMGSFEDFDEGISSAPRYYRPF